MDVGSVQPSEQCPPCNSEMSVHGLTPSLNSLSFSLGMLSMWVPNLSLSTSFKCSSDWPVFEACPSELLTCSLCTVCFCQCVLAPTFPHMPSHVSCGLWITCTYEAVHLMGATDGWAHEGVTLPLLDVLYLWHGAKECINQCVPFFTHSSFSQIHHQHHSQVGSHTLMHLIGIVLNIIHLGAGCHGSRCVSCLGLSTSTSTFMGTCGFIHGKTCTNRSPVCRYLALTAICK